MEITPRVHSIPAPQAFFSGPLAPNVYLVVDGGHGALIDAGYPDEASVKPRLEYLQGMAGPSAGSGQALKLSHILVTHHHIDTAAAPALSARPPAPPSACTPRRHAS